jgi:hypothetical protein
MTYTPDPASLGQHSIPEWYRQVKFGIFIHGSLSTIPPFVPTEKGDFHEWYLNGLRQSEGPLWEHYRAT